MAGNVKAPLPVSEKTWPLGQVLTRPGESEWHQSRNEEATRKRRGSAKERVMRRNHANLSVGLVPSHGVLVGQDVEAWTVLDSALMFTLTMLDMEM